MLLLYLRIFFNSQMRPGGSLPIIEFAKIIRIPLQRQKALVVFRRESLTEMLVYSKSYYCQEQG